MIKNKKNFSFSLYFYLIRRYSSESRDFPNEREIEQICPGGVMDGNVVLGIAFICVSLAIFAWGLFKP